jgi:competence protein ComEC
MCEIALVCLLTGSRPHLLEILCAAFLLHLAVQPAAVASLSFRLSYLALAGIALVTPGILRFLRPWLPAGVAAPLAAGLGAQAAGAPLVLSVFGQIAPFGIVAALVVGPLLAVLMGGGLVGMALSRLDLANQVSGAVLSAIARVVDWIVWVFAGAPRLDGRPAGIVAAVLAVLACGAGYLSERRRLLWTGLR